MTKNIQMTVTVLMNDDATKSYTNLFNSVKGCAHYIDGFTDSMTESDGKIISVCILELI